VVVDRIYVAVAGNLLYNVLERARSTVFLLAGLGVLNLCFEIIRSFKFDVLLHKKKFVGHHIVQLLHRFTAVPLIIKIYHLIVIIGRHQN
jgi:hypothetical protein